MSQTFSLEGPTIRWFVIPRLRTHEKLQARRVDHMINVGSGDTEHIYNLRCKNLSQRAKNLRQLIIIGVHFPFATFR